VFEGGSCEAFEADAVNAESVRDMVDTCVSEYGSIDVLQNNVGGSVPGGVVEMDEEIWDANIDHNLKSAFLSCKYAVPVMLRSNAGAIVNVSSIAGMRYHRGRDMVSYSTCRGRRSKHPASGIKINQGQYCGCRNGNYWPGIAPTQH
jgi:NAD(P)-dependent dehydrogenase (short-subunit alcohol dehydrogenase family)